MWDGTTAPARDRGRTNLGDRRSGPQPQEARLHSVPGDPLDPAHQEVQPEQDDGLGTEQRSPSGVVATRACAATAEVLPIVVAWFPQVVLHTGTGVGHAFLACTAAVVATTMVMAPSSARTVPGRLHQSSEAHRVVIASALGGAVFAATLWWFGISASAAAAVEGSGATALALTVARWLRARQVRSQNAVGKGLRDVLLVGTDADALQAWTILESEPELGYRIRAVVGDEQRDAPWAHLPAFPTSADVHAVARHVHASGIMVVPGALCGPERDELLTRALDTGLEVCLWIGVSMVGRGRIQLSRGPGPPLLHVGARRVARWQLAAKRSIDLVGAVLLAVTSAPLMVLAACAVKVQDGGPVLVRSERIGRYGNPITVLKFRTMVPEAPRLLADVAMLNERTGGPLFKASTDPRVTHVGRILRTTSVDELPQLWNVLAGTMSLVGPRPALPEEVAQFDARLRRRHDMRPGITGLWQSEARDNPCFNAYRRLDLAYVENWSLGLDLAILASTGHLLASRAYRVVRNMLMPRGTVSP